MAFAPEFVANEFLSLGERTTKPICPMKIQKLVYFAHGWHLAIERNALINEAIRAWKYGPVIESLYHRFRRFGRNPITQLAVAVRRCSDGQIEIYEPRVPTDDPTVLLIKKIWEVYSDYTPIELSNMTHEPGTPWHQIASHFGSVLPTSVIIPDDIIRDYFVRLAA